MLDLIWNLYTQLFYGSLLLWLFFIQYVWLVKNVNKDSVWYKPAVTVIGIMYLGDIFYNNCPAFAPLLFRQWPVIDGYHQFNLLGILIKIPKLEPLTSRLQRNIKEKKQGRTLLWVTQETLSLRICKYMIEPQRWGQPGHCS